MTQDDEWLVSLKDGSKIDARPAVVLLQEIHKRFRENPILVKRLFDYAPSTQAVPKDLKEAFEGLYFVRGQLREVAKAVLLNSFEIKDGELHCVCPFEDTHHNDIVLKTIAENQPIFLNRLADELTAKSRRSRNHER